MKIRKWIFNIFILGLSLIFLLPIFWLIATSFRHSYESYALPPSFFPTTIDLTGYKTVLFTDFPFVQCYLNSLKVTTITLALQLTTSTLAAFGFAKTKFKGRDFMFAVLLSTMMVPIQVTITPLFIAMSKLKLVNTHMAVILPGITSVFGIFLLRQFFASIPREIEDAARIDGASIYQIFLLVDLPQVKPAIAAFVITSLNTTWNNYFIPMIMINKWDKMTLPLAIVSLKGVYGEGNLAAVMAAVMLCVLPMMVAFLLMQKNFVEGMTMSAIKG